MVLLISNYYQKKNYQMKIESLQGLQVQLVSKDKIFIIKAPPIQELQVLQVLQGLQVREVFIT